jgi:hypothetical protein
VLNEVLAFAGPLAARFRWRAMAIVGLAFVVWVVLASQSFQSCVQANQYQHSNESLAESLRIFIGIRWWCAGVFVNSNGIAITALATIAVAWFTFSLRDATTQQGKLTKEALIVSTRAFVFLENFEPRVTISYPSGTPRNGKIFDPFIAGFWFVSRWKNSGETPTKNLTLRVRARTIRGELPADFVYDYDGEPMRAMIGPKANEWSAPIEVVANDANRVLDGETNLYVWTRAEYEDVFGRSRWTNSCSRVTFTMIDREITSNFVLYGPYNGSDADEI